MGTENKELNAKQLESQNNIQASGNWLGVLNFVVSGLLGFAQLSLQSTAMDQAERREQLQRCIITSESLKSRIDSLTKNDHLAEIPMLCEEIVNLYTTVLDQAETLSDIKLKICDVRRIAAFAYFHNQQYDQAKQQCEEILNLNAEDSTALILMGKLELLLGSIGNASKFFKVALNKNKGNPERQLIVRCYQAFISYNIDEIIDHVKICERINLVSDEALLAMQGWAYFTRNQFTAAANTFQKAIGIIVSSNPLAATSRINEVHLLKQFIATSLGLCLLFDNTNLHLLEQSLTSVTNLWKVYRKKIKKQELNHSLTFRNDSSHQYSSFITFCLLDRMVESLVFLGPLSKVTNHYPQDSTALIELYKKCNISYENQDETNQKGKGKEKINQSLLKLYFLFLKESFEQNPYEPSNLFLLTGLLEIPPTQIEQTEREVIIKYAKLAKAHLGYCYLHGYRVTQDLTQAISLLQDNNCHRGIAEYEFYKFQRFIAEAKTDDLENEKTDKEEDKKFNNERLKTVVTLPSWSVTAEYDGYLRAKVYYAITLLQSNDAENEGALKILNETAKKGIKYAQAWLANIYAFGLYGVKPKPKQAMHWIETACANISLNAPDYFYACIIQSRMYRNGKGYDKDASKSNEILLSICKMGSIAGMLELANTHWIAYKNCDTSSNPNLDFDSNTEADRETAVYWWERARELGLELDPRLLPQQAFLKYSLTLNYALATLYGQYTKKLDYLLAKTLLLDCEKLAKECQGLDLKHLYYYLGVVCEFLSEKKDDQTAKNYFQQAYKDNSEERVSVRAFSRLSFINNKNNVVSSSSVPPAATLSRKFARGHSLSATRNSGIWPSLSANCNGDIGLIFKDPSSSQSKVKIGKIKKGNEIHWSSLLIDSPFQNDSIHPRIAINSKLVVVSSCMNNKLFYKVGTQQAQSFVWSTKNDTHNGISPAIALNNKNIIVEVHRSANYNTLHYRVGKVDLQNSSIQWGSSIGHMPGSSPTVAMHKTTIMVAWERKRGIQYQLGTLSKELNIQWTDVQRLNDQYVNPCLVMTKDKVILLAEGLGNDDGLYYLWGKLNGQTITWENNSEFEYYAAGYSPTAILQDNMVFAFHEFDCGGEIPKLCRHDIDLNVSARFTLQG